jgi:hypothetical protein
MLNYMLNAGRGFHPRRCGPPPMRYLPNRCYGIIAQRRGGMGGGSCPLLHSYQHPEFHIHEKEFYKSKKTLQTFFTLEQIQRIRNEFLQIVQYQK